MHVRQALQVFMNGQSTSYVSKGQALQVFVNGQSTSYVCKVGIASIYEWQEYKLCM